MVESNPRPTRIQTPRNNIIAHSIVNKRRARLNPTSVRTQRIKSTPRRVNTTQAPVNYNKIVKEVINEYNAVKTLLNLNRKSDANKQKKANSMTEANKEKIRKYKREWRASRTEANKEKEKQRAREYWRKRKASITEAQKEAKRQRRRELENSMTEANKEKRRKLRRELYHKSRASMTEAQKEAKRQSHREVMKKRRAEQKLRKS